MILALVNSGLALPIILLLETGADVDTNSGYHRYTSLAIAAAQGHEAVVRFLLAKGANIDAADLSGDTALMSATYMRRDAVVPLLVENGANTNLQDGYGRPAITFAEAIKNFLAAAAKNQPIQQEGGSGERLRK